ncbi:MAG TPA: MASE3 domain-containing protein [Thermoguttaceae bacterium]|nr:MASE3 domain-containing protein [Thermoguttaceae bacterium]
MISRVVRPRNLSHLLVGLSVIVGLLLTRWYGSYPLFHSLVEVFSIVVAFGIFTVFWNGRRFLDNGCFLFLGIAYLFVGGIDLLHTLAYKGVEVFDHPGSNLATQLWISARCVESLSILAAPLFLHRRLNPYALVAAYAMVVALLLASIFYWGVFPDCFVGGLTTFKVASEYLICLVLVVALLLLYRRRSELDARVYRLFFTSIVLTVAAELVFTSYEVVTDNWNMTGHFLKLISFYLIYVAFVEVAMTNPYAVLFRNLKESEESLRRSEGRFRGTFENAAAGIAHVDLDGRWLLVNQRLCEIVGYPREELLQKSLQDLTHPDDRVAHKTQFEALTRARISNYSMEQRYLHREGRIVWVNLTMALQRDPSGSPRYSIAAVQDITRLKDAERKLTAINETLEQRVAERTSLAEQRAAQLRVLASELTLAEQRERRRLAQILHDHLQQFLVTAKLKLGMLRRRASDEAQEQSLGQLDELLDQAIDASRSLTVKLSPPILYDAGLAPALEWLGRQMQKKHGLAVEVHADPQAEPDTDDWRVLIFQAVRELLFNVVKHARADSARVEMTRTDEGQVRVRVSDPGVGFDPSRFEADGGSDEGSDGGFGLFSVRERLALLGGRLEIDATPGRGTRVSILAPQPQPREPGGRAPPAGLVARTPAPERREGLAAREAPSGTAAAASVEPIRVLLADDHELLREGLVSLLRDQPDMEVVGEASDGEAAVDLALKTRPDVVIMDVSMPQLSGIEATRRITATDPDIRVIGLSMHEQADMAGAMRRAGAVAYLPKDGPVEELIAAIRHASTRRGRARRNLNE